MNAESLTSQNINELTAEIRVNRRRMRELLTRDRSLLEELAEVLKRELKKPFEEHYPCHIMTIELSKSGQTINIRIEGKPEGEKDLFAPLNTICTALTGRMVEQLQDFLSPHKSFINVRGTIRMGEFIDKFNPSICEKYHMHSSYAKICREVECKAKNGSDSEIPRILRNSQNDEGVSGQMDDDPEGNSGGLP